jgi:hypothetical protein
MMNINETVTRIKAAGPSNVRHTPLDGETINGKYRIEIKEGGKWASIAECPNRKMAEEIISLAMNRTILG